MINEQEYKLIGCIIDKKHLHNFLIMVGEFFVEKTPTISINFSDNTSVKNVDSSEFNMFDFSNREIVSFSMYEYYYLYKPDEETRLSFTYNKNFHSCTIIISSSNFSKFSEFKTKLEYWIKSVNNKKREKIINILSHDTIIFLNNSIILNVITIVGTLLLFKNKSFLSGIIIGIFIPGWIFISFGITSKIKEYYPNTEIDIGFNKSKEKRKKMWLLLTVFIIPFVYMILGIIIPLLHK